MFYGWWDWRFLSLIILSTFVDYLVGMRIHQATALSIRKKWLYVSVFFNLGLLGFFKYFNFFIDSWLNVLSSLGYHAENSWSLNVILPFGISFYTFQTMSYSIDIYRKQSKPNVLVIKDVFLSLYTFSVVCLAWIFFRANSVQHVFNYISNINSIHLSKESFIMYSDIVLIVFFIGRDKLFRILRATNLLIKPKKSYHITTDSHHRFRKHKNLVILDIKKPEQVWVSDITYTGNRKNPSYLAIGY